MPTPNPSPAAREAARSCYYFIVNDYCDHIDDSALEKMQAIIDQALTDERRAAEEMAVKLERLIEEEVIKERNQALVDNYRRTRGW